MMQPAMTMTPYGPQPMPMSPYMPQVQMMQMQQPSMHKPAGYMAPGGYPTAMATAPIQQPPAAYPMIKATVTPRDADTKT